MWWKCFIVLIITWDCILCFVVNFGFLWERNIDFHFHCWVLSTNWIESLAHGKHAQYIHTHVNIYIIERQVSMNYIFVDSHFYFEINKISGICFVWKKQFIVSYGIYPHLFQGRLWFSHCFVNEVLFHSPKKKMIAVGK